MKIKKVCSGCHADSWRVEGRDCLLSISQSAVETMSCRLGTTAEVKNTGKDTTKNMER